MDSSILPRVDDKALEFEINIQDAQFNLEGKYFLKLSIQSLHTKDYSKIKIKETGATVFSNKYEGETDTVSQKESSALAKFSKNKFVFRLPKGELLYYSLLGWSTNIIKDKWVHFDRSVRLH